MKICSIFNKNSDSCNGKCCVICNIIATIVISLIVSLIVNATMGASRVKSVIKKDPEFIVDSINEMYKKKQDEERKNREKKAPEVAKSLNEKNNPYLGNKNGSKVIIEFFDYACGHCKKQSQELHKVIQQNKDVKVVLADLAIMSQHSLLSAQVGVYIGLYAPSKMEKYYLGMSKEQVTPENIKKVLKNIGLPENYVERATKDTKVREVLERNFNAARDMGLQGTPALVIGDKFIPGMITADDIISILK